ncbi:sigma-70 family RNA polymerase sigma factor [Clostridium tetani]|uniref:sigma-70 family RNA polymerase sigma factor n=1 Tax=Clostridium tetani TaxID=1513 RepID=UPI0024A93B99|nr:sigma-70 family RNA polymerase sigma factor [Clostridium tetani]
MNQYRNTESLLYNYRNTKAEIKNILLEIEDIENSYRGIGAVEYSDMPKAHNNTSSVESEIENKEKRIEYLNQLIIKKENQIKRVDNALEALTDDEYKVIKYRYFIKVSNKKLAEILDLTEQTTSIMKGKIINKISKLIFF